MYVLNITYTPYAAAPRYRVLNRKVLKVATTLESTQEELYTTLVEYHNQQHIYRWVISCIHIKPLQLKLYNEWELHADFGIRIMVKSRYSNLLG